MVKTNLKIDTMLKKKHFIFNSKTKMNTCAIVSGQIS